MKILLVAATQLEIEPFISTNKNTDVLICGVGIPSTVYNLTKKLLNDKYDIVIQAGIAGSFSDTLRLGEVILVEHDIFADIGVEENESFKTVFQIGLEDENTFPFEKGWLINRNEFLFASPLKKIKAITLNKISESEIQKEQLMNNFNADIESMEGAAFHYVCLQQKIPFIQLRSISNEVGERNKTKWKMKEAIENLNDKLIKIVELLNG